MLIQFLLFLADILLINLVFLISFFIRYGLPLPEGNFGAFRGNFVFLAFMYILSLALNRAFKHRFSSHWEVIKRLSKGMFFGTLFGFMLVYIFRLKWAAFPSSIFAISFPIGILLISICNLLILRTAGCIKKKVIIVGEEKEDNIIGDHALVEMIRIDNIEDILLHQDADEIVLCEKIHDDCQLNFLLFLLAKSKIKVVFSPSLYADIISGNLTDKMSIDFLATFLGRKTEWEECLIRVLDIAVSLAIFIIGLPVMFFIIILIKTTSHGPVFYLQKRAGKDGKLFTLIKFRTMVDGAETHTGPVLANKEDERITKIGKFLRQARLDELPQIFNVIKGQMSMVGPRPERPHFVKLHKALRGIRLAVKPGLTGFAQIRSLYDLNPKHKLKYDYLYIQRRSVLLNLYIILKTIPVVLSKKGQ